MEIVSHQDHVISVPPLRLAATGSDYHSAVVNALMDRRMLLDTALSALLARSGILIEIARLLVETLRHGHKVLVAGNGGSAAEAQHFAAELVGRFKRNRSPYAVLALTSDSVTLTALSNDYGYQDVFARQVQAFGQEDDLFIAFSTSGESDNLVRAASTGLEGQVKVVAVTGDRPSRLGALADLTLRVPTVDTALAQELHMIVTHILCDIAETQLSSCEGEVCQ